MPPSKIVTIIPARMGSSRFPGKPLALMCGMPMLGHCWHRAKLATGDDNLYVATCDVQIADYVSSIGGKVVMTSSEHDRASDRTAEALQIIESTSDEAQFTHIMMIQGDEPLFSPEVLKRALNYPATDADVTNIMSRITNEAVFQDENNVKVVCDRDNRALYFSRSAIPSAWKGFDKIHAYMQTGLMMFSRKALQTFRDLPQTQLEVIESVDLNRLLEFGLKCQMVPMEAETLGVDTPDELAIAEQLLSKDAVTRHYLRQ